MNKRGIDMGNRLSGIMLAGGIVAAGFCLAGLGAGNTSALDLSVNTPADPILEVSLSSSLVQLDLTPSMNTADFKTADLTVTAGTNNITGYTLYMDVDSPDLTRTEAINNTTPVIASLAENEQGYTEANFTANSWGYRIGSGNFLAIPAGNLTLSSNTSPSNGNSTTVTFASKVDMSQPAGSYSTDVNIIAIANPILELQDVDNWEGSIAVGQVVKAKDIRDNKYYTVGRMVDDRIWFLDNLAIDLTDPAVQANLSAATTNASSTSLGYLINGGGTSGGQYAASGVSTAASTTDYNYNNPLVYMANADDIPSGSLPNSRGNRKQGGLYNFCAAAAGAYCYNQNDGVVDEIIEDICPAEWRLPTGGSYGEYLSVIKQITGVDPLNSRIYYRGSVLNEEIFDQIYAEFGFINNVSMWSKTGTGDGNSWWWVFQSTTSIMAGNAFSRSTLQSIRCIAKKKNKITFNANGGTGTMPVQSISESGGILNVNTFTKDGYAFAGWNTAADGSGTPYANGATYNGPSTILYAQWKELPPAGTFERAFAEAGKGTINIGGGDYYKMQDMTSSICSNTGVNQKSSLVDIRDNKVYTVGKIGAVCWMTKNLNITGGITLTPEESNVASNYTLPTSSTAGFNDNTKAFVYNDSTYGGYYSYVAATAGINPSSGESAYDICPKGWELPSRTNYDTLISTVAALAAAPWYGAYGGYRSDGSVGNVGSDIRYWSSTSDGSSSAVHLLSGSSFASTTYSNYKYYGLLVRCVAQ